MPAGIAEREPIRVVETKPKLKDAASKRTTKTKMARASCQVVGVAFIGRTVASYRRTAFAEYPRARWSAGPLKHYPEGSSSSRAVGRGDLAPSVAAKRYDKQYLFVI